MVSTVVRFWLEKFGVKPELCAELVVNMIFFTTGNF
jgi:hypothetical protein